MRLSLRRPDDEGSLPLAMLVITVVMSLSAVIAPIVTRQIRNTQSYAQHGGALDAAQAGLDVMMARVRAASDNLQNGLLENMPPCTMTGTIGATGGGISAKYTVTVKYYDQDQDGTKFAGCAINDVPATAQVISVGTDGTASRTLTATYVFSTSNTNIPGGPIKIATSSVKNSSGVLLDQCLDGGAAASPAAGAPVTVQKCDGSSRQQFGYTPDLYLKLISSESSSASLGMCLYASSSKAVPRSDGSKKAATVLVFQPCPAVREWRFQWALDGSSVFHATTTANDGTSGKPDDRDETTTTAPKSDSFCMNIKSPGTSTDIVLGTCGATATKNVWYSAPGVGAGMAGDATNQLVNYKQFSRCLDVTNKDTGATYMIAWFCKQDPGALVDFNQQWVHPVPVLPAVSKSGPIIVNNTSGNSNANNGSASKNYCLKSPGTTTSTSWVTVESCSTAALQAQEALTWTVYHDTGDYGTSYRIMDYKGNCLQPTEQGSGVANEFHGDGTSKVKVAVCTTADIQKWNAPANVSRPTPLTNLTEK